MDFLKKRKRKGKRRGSRDQDSEGGSPWPWAEERWIQRLVERNVFSLELWSKYSPRKRISDFWSQNHETETPMGLSHTPSHFYRRLWKLTQTPRAQRLRSEHEGDASWVADTLAEYTAVSSDTDQGGLSSLTNIQLSKRLWYLCKPGLQHIDSLHHSSAEEVP